MEFFTEERFRTLSNFPASNVFHPPQSAGTG